jgi:hypothetical protein
MVGNPEISVGTDPSEEGKTGSFLLNNRVLIRKRGATEDVVMLTKHKKIGLCEQIRVNWKTAWFFDDISCHGHRALTSVLIQSGNLERYCAMSF